MADIVIQVVGAAEQKAFVQTEWRAGASSYSLSADQGSLMEGWGLAQVNVDGTNRTIGWRLYLPAPNLGGDLTATRSRFVQ